MCIERRTLFPSYIYIINIINMDFNFNLKDCCLNGDCEVDAEDLVRSLMLNLWAPFSKGAKCLTCGKFINDDVQLDATSSLKSLVSEWLKKEVFGKIFDYNYWKA